MVFARYLAMTADELASVSPPEQLCYLACHFSPYGFGLCNIPDTLPPGAMLCVNDRIPIQSHDPALVASQLARAVDVLEAESVLLEFRRGGDVFVDAILRELSCPVGVWEGDAQGRGCPVFLDCPEVNVPIDRHLAPWQGREIWLEEHKPSAALRSRKTVAPSATGMPFPARSTGMTSCTAATPSQQKGKRPSLPSPAHRRTGMPWCKKPRLWGSPGRWDSTDSVSHNGRKIGVPDSTPIIYFRV